MKRLLILFWMVALTLSVLSCGKEQAQNNDTPPVDDNRPIPATLDLHIGETFKIVPKVDAGRPYHMGINDEDNDIATMDQDGLVTAKSNGNATIFLVMTDTYESWECIVRVTTPVSGISLDITSNENLIMGQSFTLEATVTPGTASNKNIVWTSSAPESVSISASGVTCTVNALQGTRTATITAKTEDGEFTAKCTVSVATANTLYGASTETSNCYVIYQGGHYVLDLVMGNSTQSVGKVKKAVILWETCGTDETITEGMLVSDCFYSECLDKIVFTIPNPIKNGNALIAAKDQFNNTLWSWHLWLCNGYIPDRNTQTYSNGTVMMDRNLGATNSTSTKGEDHGMLYQWGRKDPFPGFSSGTTRAFVTYPASQTSATGSRNLGYSIANPKAFISSSNTSTAYDWLDTKDKTLWRSSKSKYDPCPPGWRVPDGGPTNTSGVWRQSSGAADFYVYCDTGADLSESFGGSSSPSIWYPLTGAYGNTYGAESNAYYWSCTTDGDDSYCLKIERNISGKGTNIHTDAKMHRAYGLSVRCCKK